MPDGILLITRTVVPPQVFSILTPGQSLKVMEAGWSLRVTSGRGL